MEARAAPFRIRNTPAAASPTENNRAPFATLRICPAAANARTNSSGACSGHATSPQEAVSELEIIADNEFIRPTPLVQFYQPFSHWGVI
jgi:hypothetical protein